MSDVFKESCSSDMPPDYAQICLFAHTYGAGRTLLAGTGTGHRGQLHMYVYLIYCMCVHMLMHMCTFVCCMFTDVCV